MLKLDFKGSLRYDFVAGGFIKENENGTGRTDFTENDADALAKMAFDASGDQPGGKTSKGVGSTTLQRAVLAHSILQASRSPDGRKILVAFQQELSEKAIAGSAAHGYVRMAS